MSTTWFVGIFLQFMIYLVLGKKSLKFDKYEVCGKSKNCPIKQHNWTLQYNRNGGFSFCGKFELFRDLDSNGVKATFDVERCASKEALDTCEKLTKIVPPNICMALELQGVGVDEFRNGFEPPLRCPFKKGIFKMKNATLNPELFRMLPLDNYYWKLNASLYENKKYIASICVDFEVLILRG